MAEWFCTLTAYSKLLHSVLAATNQQSTESDECPARLCHRCSLFQPKTLWARSVLDALRLHTPCLAVTVYAVTHLVPLFVYPCQTNCPSLCCPVYALFTASTV